MTFDGKYNATISDLQRRLSSAVLIGKVSQVDAEKGRYRVKSGEIETDWLPMASPRAGTTKQYSSLTVDEQVLIVSPSGDMSQGVIVSPISTEETQASDKENVHKTIYPDGTTIEYDHEAKRYKMDVAAGGSYEMNIGGGVTLVASGGQATLTAPDGIKLSSPGGIELESATLTHNGVDISEHHKHTDVVPGTDISGPPVGGS